MAVIVDIFDWWRSEIGGLTRLVGPFGRFDVGVVARQSEGHVFEGPCLTFDLAKSRMPLSRSLEIAEAVAQNKTPFPIESVHIIPATTDLEKKQSFFFVIRKTSIEPLLSQLAASRLRANRLGLRHGGNVEWIPSRALEHLHPAFHHFRRWRNFLVASIVAVLGACSATYAHSFFRYSEAEQSLVDQIELKRAEALQVRKLLDKQQKSIAAVESARKGKSQAVPVVNIWEELTRVLPDDAWLTEVMVDGNTLTISGIAAQSAASLISILDASALFSEPGFISPVVRTPGQNGERFEIRLKLQPS